MWGRADSSGADPGGGGRQCLSQKPEDKVRRPRPSAAIPCGSGDDPSRGGTGGVPGRERQFRAGVATFQAENVNSVREGRRSRPRTAIPCESGDDPPGNRIWPNWRPGRERPFRAGVATIQAEISNSVREWRRSRPRTAIPCGGGDDPGRERQFRARVATIHPGIESAELAELAASTPQTLIHSVNPNPKPKP